MSATNAPEHAVELLASRLKPEDHPQLLDAGCGTGLVGRALKAKGFHDVVGIDPSSESLDVAAKAQSYRALAEADFGSLPLNLSDGSFSGLVSVGALSDVANLEEVLREFCRVVHPKGTIVVTERSDLFDERRTGDVFKALEADESWKIITVTEPLPYLPDDPEFVGVEVRYGVFEAN